MGRVKCGVTEGEGGEGGGGDGGTKGGDKSHQVSFESYKVGMERFMYVRDSLCRDGADMPRPPYIGKACTRSNATFVSLFRHLTVVLKCFCT